jgi:hypothetical protein
VASIASRCVGTCGGNIDGVLIAGDIGLALERGCSPGSRFVPGNWPRRKTVWPRDDTARFKVRFACGGLCACIRRISAGFRDRGTIPKVLEVLAVAQGAVVGLVLSLGCMPCAGEPWVLRQHHSVASSPLLSESPSVSLAVLADTQGLGFDFLAFLVGGMSLSRSISTKVFAEISFGFALPVSTITPTASSSTSVIVIPLCTLKRFVCGWKLCPLKRFVCGGVPSPRGTSVWCA